MRVISLLSVPPVRRSSYMPRHSQFISRRDTPRRRPPPSNVLSALIRLLRRQTGSYISCGSTVTKRFTHSRSPITPAPHAPSSPIVALHFYIIYPPVALNSHRRSRPCSRDSRLHATSHTSVTSQSPYRVESRRRRRRR